jgi:hypothetical protein
MVFLAPIPALIATALTVPVLIAYYLLRLRRRPVRVSSTLLWMQAVRDVQVNVPFRWLRPSWLFFLQLLVLALLLIALARPAIETGSSATTKLVLLIDRTASMSAVDSPGGQTRLDVAKQDALRTLDQMWRGSAGGLFSRGGNVSAAVIAIGAEPVALTAFTTDRGRLRSIIEAIEPSDQPGRSAGQPAVGDDAQGAGALQAALDLAGAMLAGDVEEESVREAGAVVLFSDGVLAGSAGYSLAGEFRYVRVGPPEPPDNLGIVALSARRDWEDPGSIRIFVRVVNAGSSEVVAPLALFVDDLEVQRTAVVVPSGRPAAAENGAEDPLLGEAAVTFRLDLQRGGTVTVELLYNDALASDNRSSIAIDPARRSRILVVAPDSAVIVGEDGGLTTVRATQWITDVVREMQLPLRTIPASAYERESAAWGAGTEPAADLVIFDRVEPTRLPPIPTLSFGGSIPLPAVSVEAGTSENTYFLSWQRTHPVLRHVALDNIVIARAQRIAIDVPAAREAGIRLSELARGPDGPLIVQIDDQRITRLHVGFELNQSNWPLNYGFPIFLAAAIDHLTLRGEGSAGRAWTTAEPVIIPVPSGVSRLVLEGPERLTIDIPPPPQGAAMRRANLGTLDRAGVYRIVGLPGIEGVEAAIPVNLLDQTESLLRGQNAIRVGGEAHAARPAGIGPREIWHWFVLGALGLLCLEWFLNAARMRV